MFFILGNPRSGTTLLRLMLTCHPKIHVPPECGFIIWWAKKYFREGGVIAFSEINKIIDDLISSKKFEFWKLEYDEIKKAFRRLDSINYEKICTILYTLHSNNNGKINAVLGDKNNFHTKHILDLNMIFPDCKFIHIVRDGRDVAASYLSIKDCEMTSDYYPKLKKDIESIAKEWSENLSIVSRNFKELQSSRLLEIKYEDLVTEPQKILRRVCNHLGLEFVNSMLDFHIINKRDKLEPIEFLEWKSQTLEPVNNSSIGRYKILGKDSLKLFEKIAIKSLSKYGYV